MSKLHILQVLNFAVGLGYVALSIGFASMWKLLGEMMGRRTLDAGERTWWCAVVGSALFLFGCGVHHFHLALEMIPASVHRFGAGSLWIQHFNHEVVIAAAQAVGAPLVLGAGFGVFRATLRSRRPGGLRATDPRPGV